MAPEVTKEELLVALKAASASGDTEIAHNDADEALVAFIGDAEIKAAYDAIGKWYA